MTDVKSHGKSAGNDPQLKGVVGMLAQKTPTSSSGGLKGQAARKETSRGLRDPRGCGEQPQTANKAGVEPTEIPT